MHSVFILVVTARYKATRRFFDSVRFLQLESLTETRRLADRKLGGLRVSACMYASLRQGVCVCICGCFSSSLSHTRGGRILCNFGLLKTEMTIKATTLF